jgi:undecaprenyl-diphosphatase
MFEYIIYIDKSLFLLINQLPHMLFTDSFFGILSGAGYAGIIWFVIGISIFIWEEIRDRRLLLTQIIAGSLSFFLVDILLKNFFQRFRPEFRLPTAIVVMDFTKSYSFPSGHTTVAFAMAIILSRKYARWSWFYYLLAILIAFSRVYLGKHYPGDILAGAVLGTVIGLVSMIITKRIIRDLRKGKKRR